MLTQDRRRRVVLTMTLSAMVAACSSPVATAIPTEATSAVPPSPTLAECASIATTADVLAAFAVALRESGSRPGHQGRF